MPSQRIRDGLDCGPDCWIVHEFQSKAPGTVQYIDLACVDLIHQIPDEVEIIKLAFIELPRNNKLVIGHPPKSIRILSDDPGEPDCNLDCSLFARLFACRFVGLVEGNTVNVNVVDHCPLP